MQQMVDVENARSAFENTWTKEKTLVMMILYIWRFQRLLDFAGKIVKFVKYIVSDPVKVSGGRK